MNTLPSFLLFALFLFDAAIKIVLIFYVPRGRKPTAAMAWLLSILLLPGILGIILFFLIGGTKLSRKRQARQRAVDRLLASSARIHEQSATINEDSTSFVRLNQALSQFPAIDANALKIISDYDHMIKAITTDIDNASKYIYIESYIMALDDVTMPLFDAMTRAQQRGVAVYVLFDAFGSRKFSGYKVMRRRLTTDSIHWVGMLPITLRPSKYNRPDLRNHRKLIAIDNTCAYIGSLNLIEPRYERKDDIIYEELVARLEGPIVYHIAATIAGDWYSETELAITEFSSLPVISSKTNLAMQLLPSGPAYPNENNLKLFLSLIYAARHKIIITNPYLVPSEPLVTALITAAQRGTEVVILNSQAVDQWMVGHAQRSYYEQLLDAGITIYLHKAPVLLHSKHMTIDDTIAVIGSSNMDVRSFELNYESSLVVYDSSVVKELVKMQVRNISGSFLLTQKIWKKRRPWALFLDSIARLTSALQ
jgi:cardiolipin synthase